MRIGCMYFSDYVRRRVGARTTLAAAPPVTVPLPDQSALPSSTIYSFTRATLTDDDLCQITVQFREGPRPKTQGQFKNSGVTGRHQLIQVQSAWRTVVGW